MARTITITKAEKKANGSILIRAGKLGVDAPNLAALQDLVREKFGGVDSTDEFMLLIGIAMMLKRQPGLTNMALFEGRTLTLDLTSNTPLVVG